MNYGVPAESAPQAPRCYRHPDRETWIVCARCHRPICPDCMIAADVGFQCPECVGEAARARPTPRTVFGGRLSREGFVTNIIIGSCVVLFLSVSLNDALGGLQRWGMSPLAVAVLGQWGRLITSIFLHGGWLHLAFNMYVLFLFGPPLERMLGHARFLVLFLLSGLGGSVASYAFSPVLTLSVGASGAIFGLMTAMIVLGRKLGYDVGQVVVLLGINVALGFFLAGIDWRAHLGGAAVGAIVAYVMTLDRPGPAGARRPNTPVQVASIIGVLVMLAVIVAAQTARLQSLVVVG